MCYNNDNETIIMSYEKGTLYQKHGDSRTDEYQSWLGMKHRCKNQPHYINKGIQVCDEWLNDYPQFLKDMGKKPKKDCSLDRINNKEGYNPTNCRWVDRTTQQRNQDQSRWVSVNGERKHIVELSEEYGIPYNTLNHRWKKGIRGEKILESIRKPRKNKNQDVT